MDQHDDARKLFRLDFALRGRTAYTKPLSLERLVKRVEQRRLELGAPLLLWIDEHLVPPSDIETEHCRKRLADIIEFPGAVVAAPARSLRR